nr:SWI/SNF-related matrix-associated actin-dependent regulator of chromatin subfamily B member 1-like [Hydra vulgaris]
MARIVSHGNNKTPAVYQLEKNGEHWMLGSEVGSAMQFYKGALYKRFPSLYRRVLTLEERQILCNLNVDMRTLTNLGTMVVKASEARKVLSGDGDIYRQKNTQVAKENNKNKIAINIAFCRQKTNIKDQENCTYIPTACGKELKSITSKLNIKSGFAKVKNDSIDSTNVEVRYIEPEFVSVTTLPTLCEKKKNRSREFLKQLFKVK